jgi:hypothetical protein
LYTWAAARNRRWTTARCLGVASRRNSATKVGGGGWRRPICEQVYALSVPTTTPRFLRSRHSGSLLFAHLVVVVKYRRRVLGPALLGELRVLWTEECQHLGAVLVECNGEADHVPLLLRYPPSLPLWHLVQ